MLTMGSLFDGIGGFPLAAVHSGVTPVWASEIEEFPIEVTKIRFPDMVHVGDITKLDGAKLPPVDILCGGSPCQDLSVAGNRAGLAGERSGLFMEQVRIAKEMRIADERRGTPAHHVRPRYLVWENVPGAFSSADGEDFRAVLEEIVRVKYSTNHVPRPDTGRWESAGGILLGDEFSLAWRVLDAQYWGVPQRRRRIFLVADFGGATAPEILFKQDSLLGNTAQGAGTREGASAAAQAGADDSGGACLTPWDVQSRRVFRQDGTWPALYSGEGGGHGYIHAEESVTGFDGYNGDLTGGVSATLGINCGMSTGRNGVIEQSLMAFAANQRDEVRDLHGVSGALQAQPGMKQQTFIAEGASPGKAVAAAGVVTKGNGDCFLTPEAHTSLTMGGGQAGQGYPCVLTAGFCAGAAPSAGGIGYQAELAPTLKAADSGTNMVPSILCLNDQGGAQMHCTQNQTGTLRAQEHGHQPLVFDNHSQDARFTGPVSNSQTISAGFGMGGNNTPLVAQHPPVDDPIQPDSFCIAGNIIDRQVQNGGNGLGCQADISYTLTSADRHAVFSRQRSDEFISNDVVATQSARQHKDATDLVCQPDFETYQQTVGTIGYTDHKGVNNQFVSEDKCIVERRNLIRRLTPLECERLQGFPDGWTLIPDASDSARYKALGNSVAIPCVDFILRGIAFFLRKIYSEMEE